MLWNLTRSGCERVCCTKDRTTSLDGVKTLEDDTNNRTGGHVLDETGEEGLALEVSVV